MRDGSPGQGLPNRASVIVAGAGAAGLFGAIACAEANPEASIHIFEAGREALAKVRISGGGRCNVTHHCFDPAVLVTHYPRGSNALRGPFSRFQPQDTVNWFEQRGVPLKTEADGRMFPTTDDSGTIVDCLLGEARRLGIQIHTSQAIAQVQPDDNGFWLTTRAGVDWRCDRLLLATGSSPGGYRMALKLGHDLVPPVPSLFTFNIPDPALRELAGVSVETVQLHLALEHAPELTQRGPLLITHWGMSGPAVLKLSAYGAVGLHRQRYRATLTVNWLPERSQDSMRQKLLALKQDQGRRQVAAFSPFPELSRRLWQYLAQHRAGLGNKVNWADLSKAQLQALVTALTRGEYAIAGKGVFKDEFVTCGGIPLPEVNFKTMESRRCPGLHLAGEILNIDGVTGGFNFQNAWTTGWLAGNAIAAALRP
ncbi:NAD(P)/FAD-dependent oxidoreductase [Nodosilinea nodulosa]|uniref:NAD(P)/FAD-dependent oxidoreductase n=1 Tax=Nodosilinea nodulosa TaxID=416001 RepID=UPI0002D42859|nr:NAD(P)/FAD-dependent oxidoreductase [Nodosilinea nodulosa]